MRENATQWDVVIIGAGLSGLAAGIRLAHYGNRVCILERHTRAGGLNSYYRRGGRDFDTGLHAITNYALPTQRRLPLSRVLRQLRIRLDDLDPCPQHRSAIRFPDLTLPLTNDVAALQNAVAAAFPDQAEGFAALVDAVDAYDAFSLDRQEASGVAFMSGYVSDRRLREMLLCPLMFYGNAREHDMECGQMCILFQSLFREGMFRPRHGVRTLIELLLSRFRESGGVLKLGCGVDRLETTGDTVGTIHCSDGSTQTAGHVLSCAGYAETLELCEPGPDRWPTDAVPGALGYVEVILVLDRPVQALGFSDCISFECAERPFRYACPTGAWDPGSGVVCAPGNFPGVDIPNGEGRLRCTHLANPDAWFGLDADTYAARKAEVRDGAVAALRARLPGLSSAILATDVFTPRTIERYTGHQRGAIYGSPVKHPTGEMPYSNLHLCGTDQGFLGIVGAMMSGVSIANGRLLRA